MPPKDLARPKGSVDPILSHESYTAEMAKSLIDKVFFLDKVDAGFFVDFGCGDGVMLDFISRTFPGVELLGYDNDPAMVEAARKRSPGIRFTGDWNEVADAVELRRKAGTGTCLVLSSVVHEAVNYLAEPELSLMWKRVWGEDGPAFDYVAVRDMMVSATASRPSDPIAAARVRQVFDQARIAEWERQWGSLDENWSLVHFFLTYRYAHSWKREMKENYLPWSVEEFLGTVPRAYFPAFKEHFTLPFLRRRVRDDFGVDLAERTHLKLVLERRGEGA